MKLIVQRVLRASVSTNNEMVAGIKHGLFVLMGVKNGDAQKDAEILAEKLAKLRVMADDAGKMNLSIMEAGGEILVVSQFTLYANTHGGNRPSFLKSAPPDVAEPLYEYFIQQLRLLGLSVRTGKFGAYMHIEAELDGPVTIILET